MPTDDRAVPILEEELKFFDSQKPDLLKRHSGQFVLIKGSKLLGTYKSETEAYSHAVKQLGNVPFLIKQVMAKEEPVWIPIINKGMN